MSLFDVPSWCTSGSIGLLDSWTLNQFLPFHFHRGKQRRMIFNFKKNAILVLSSMAKILRIHFHVLPKSRKAIGKCYGPAIVIFLHNLFQTSMFYYCEPFPNFHIAWIVICRTLPPLPSTLYGSARPTKCWKIMTKALLISTKSHFLCWMNWNMKVCPMWLQKV